MNILSLKLLTSFLSTTFYITSKTWLIEELAHITNRAFIRFIPSSLISQIILILPRHWSSCGISTRIWLAVRITGIRSTLLYRLITTGMAWRINRYLISTSVAWTRSTNLITAGVRWAIISLTHN